MSRAAEYILSWSEIHHRYELSSSSTQELLSIIPDGTEWFTWLSHVSSFAFRGKQYALTARCEHTQRGNMYWQPCYIALTTRLTFSDEDLASLYMRTEGWVAGLQLFTLSLQGKVGHAQLMQGFTGGHRYIFDYLLQEILIRQSAQVESFLLQTSILEYLHSGLCEAVTYALASKDFERVAHIAELVGVRMVERGEVVTVQRWISELPRELICSSLRLCLFEGWRLALNNQYADAQRLVEEYDQHKRITSTCMLEEPGELLGEQLALRSTLAMRGQGNLPLAMDCARQALLYYPPESMGRALILFNLGTISWIMGDQQAAIETFSESIRVSQAVRSVYSIALSVQMLCHLFFQRGQLRRIERLLQEVIPEKQEQQLPGTGPLYICLGMLQGEWNRVDEAQAILYYLLHNVEEQERTGSVIEILVQLALVKQEQRKTSEARKRLMSALALAEPEGYLRVFLDEAPAIIPLLVNVREVHAKGQFFAVQACSLHYLDTLLECLDVGNKNARERQIANGLLSEREMEVLQLLAAGCSNREIAYRLVIALSTVKSHVNTIYNKLTVASRTQAIARARELHLILPMTTGSSSSHP